MPKDYDFNHGDPFPAWWTDAVQEFIGTDAPNFRLVVLNGTTVRACGAASNDQSAIGIGGLFRYRATNHDVAASGAAGVKDLYVVASANVIGGVNSDTTDYLYYLQIKDSGVTPTGNTPAANAIAAYRKVGEIDWSGTAITGIRTFINNGDTRDPLYLTAPIAGVSPLTLKLAATPTANALSILDSAAAQLAAFDSAGKLLFGTDTNLYRGAADTLKTDDSLQVGASLALTTGSSSTVNGQITSAANTLSFFSGTATARFKLDGTGIGFFGATPVAQSTGWGAALATNFTGAVSRKSLTGSYTQDQLRDVVATVVDALRAYGILGA